MAATPDFWPDIGDAKPKVTPLSLMKQQAALLGKRTQNLLEARVVTIPHEKDVVLSFVIEVPVLGYQYELFRVRQNMVDLYPVVIVSAPKLGEGPHRAPVLRSEDEFLEWLKDVLNSDTTKRVLGSLLAQVET
jgi:hypothetical protein